MKTFLKELLTKQMPVYAVVFCIFCTAYITHSLRQRPPLGWIGFTISGIEKFDNKTEAFSKDYEEILLQLPESNRIVYKEKGEQFFSYTGNFSFKMLEEYYQIFRVFYGTLPEEYEAQFKALKKKAMKK